MPALEHYTPGYAPRIVRFMERRTAETHAAFFLPHLRSGLRLLDCGCGPGTITRGLAARVGPGPVVGVDVEETQLDIARSDLRNPANLTYRNSGVYQLPFPDAHFDAVFAHALFEHLGEPVKAARELRRVTKPGGLIGLCAPDWDGFLFGPPDPEVLAAAALYRRLQEDNGGNPTAGRSLGLWLTEAGWSEVQMSARYECQDDLHLMGEFLRDRLERSPKQDDVSLKRILQALRTWEKRRDGLFALAWVSAIARA
jgi:SAM-dependent methyltransferase